ncbi:MAG TPA: SBBP repeat-containing protein, partial [Bryobacteraceae bacterium]|nr:SBBP repeat-containing protein [Bryobacteraceae bacterium]
LQSPQLTTATAIATDAAGDLYVTGSTDDPAFPATPGAFQTKLNNAADQTNAFAMKLEPSGATAWATYLGGPGSDQANSISLDSADNVWLTGTNAAGFPSTLPPSRWVTTAAGDFVIELTADGSKLLSSMELPNAGQALAFDASGTLHVASQPGLVSTVTLGQPSTPRILGIMNAAQGPVSGRIAPSEIISIFGFGLGPATPAAATPENGAYPTSLAGIQVLVNGAPIPLLYVSDSQINAEIPSPLNGIEDGRTSVQVLNGSATLPAFRTSVDTSNFGIFLNPDGSIAAINQDGTLNSKAHPALAGTIVSMWATGRPSSVTVDGAVAAAADNWCMFCQIAFGGVSETVAYGGAAPGLIDGVMQLNFLIPANVSLANPTSVTVKFEDFGPTGQFWIE